MGFLIIIVILGLYFYLPQQLKMLQSNKWLWAWYHFIQKYAASLKPLSIIAFFAPFVVVAWIVLPLIEHRFLGIFYLVLLVLLLAFSVGRKNLEELFQNYIAQWKQGQGASELDELFDGEKIEIDNDQHLHLAARQQLLYQSLEQLFCTVFWFAITGLLIPLVYRVLHLLYDRNTANVNAQLDVVEIPLLSPDTMKKCIAILEWLPMQVFAFLLNFVADKKGHGFDALLNSLLSLQFSDISAQLHKTATQTLDLMPIADLINGQEVENFYPQAEQELRDLRNNVIRVFVLFVCVCAVLSILF